MAATHFMWYQVICKNSSHRGCSTLPVIPSQQAQWIEIGLNRLNTKHCRRPKSTSIFPLFLASNSLRMVHFFTHLHSSPQGAMSSAFCRSTDTTSRSSLSSCHISLWWQIWHQWFQPNWPSEMLTASLSLWLMTHSQSLMAWLNSFIPL